MASEGPNSPSSATNVGAGSNWSNPTNVLSSNNSYATGVFDFPGKSIEATNFGFSAVTGTIDGIVVEVERKSSAASSTRDSIIRLVKGGSAVGDNKASASNWPTSDAYATYGSSSDLWGTTWSASDITASNFGVDINAINTSENGATASVDHVRITVYYTSSTTYNETATGGVKIGSTVTPNVTYTVTPTGGCLVGGTVTPTYTANITANGGTLINSSATQNETYANINGSGGVLTSGIAAQDETYANINGLGGVLISGNSELTRIHPNIDASGGVLISGSAEITRIYPTENALGGILTSGNSDNTKSYPNFDSSGGVLISNPAIDAQATYNIDITGGILVNGSATPSEVQSIEASGGTSINGSADVNVITSVIATGGTLIQGNDYDTIIITHEATGGVLIWGYLTVAEIASGGLTINGSATVDAQYSLISTGGTTLSGHAFQINDIVVGGGVTVSGNTTPSLQIDINASGGVELNSSAVIDCYQYTSSGSVIIGNSGNTKYSPYFVGNSEGTVIVGANSAYTHGPTHESSGFVIIGGQSKCGVPHFNFFTTFNKKKVGIVIQGESNVSMKTYINAGIKISGSATLDEFKYSTSGGVIVGGDSSIPDLTAIFNPQGGVVISGESDYYTNYFIYTSDGSVYINGMADYGFTINDFDCELRTLSCIIKFPNYHTECPEILFFLGDCKVYNVESCNPNSGGFLAPVIACRQKILPQSDRHRNVPKN